MTASRLLQVVALLLFLSPQAAPTSVPFDAFARGEWRDGDIPPLEPEALIAAAKELKEAAPAYALTAGPAQEQRRRLVVATYVLHLLETQDDPLLWQGGGRPFRYRRPLPAVDLLEWACGFLRAAPPLVAERWWHLGAVALLERHGAQETLDLHLQHAHGRFPSEERWVLGRAIAEDLRTWPEARDDRPFLPQPVATAALIGRYEEAIARDSIRDEALVRLGYFDLRRNRPETALAYFDRVGAAKDPAVRYWRHLFRGQALERMKRVPEAIDDYRAALEDAPDAQSASLALASALSSVHRDDEAAAVVRRAITTRPVAQDPWTDYTYPDWRFRGRVMSELRKAIAP